MPLSKDQEIRKTYQSLKGDPSTVAVIREAFAGKREELIDLSLYWLSVYVDSAAEYEEEVGRTQLDLENGELQMKPTPAESRAKAICRDTKAILSQARYVKKFYGDLLRHYENKTKW